MPISFRRSVSAATGLLVPSLLLCLVSLTAPQASGQDTQAPPTRIQKQLSRMDFSVAAVGEITNTVSGIEQRDANVVSTITNGDTTTTSTGSTLLAIKPSGTVGELFTLRYTAKPYLGFEFNFGNLRYTQDYAFTTTTNTTTTNSATTPPTVTNGTAVTHPQLIPGVQASARELTLGYVAHLPYHPFGVQPYVGVGAGTIRFKPTPFGGEGLPFQYRAAFYYSLGVEGAFASSHFGYRLGFRQLVYLAPDFQQNYLTINRRVRTSEPVIGFYVRF